MRQYAKYMDMTYHESDQWGLYNRLLDFEIIRIGKGTIFNLLEWKSPFMDEQVFIFDYKYTRGSGSSKKDYYQTIFHINSKKLGLPEFFMRPENFFDKVGSYLGIEDIDFESHPKFSDQYHLQSPDEKRLRYLMDDKLLHFFTIEKNWTLEGVGYYLLFYKKHTLLSPATIRRFHQKGVSLYDMFKDK